MKKESEVICKELQINITNRISYYRNM